MSRLWTARKLTPLHLAALDSSAAAYPVDRAGPPRAEAGKQALRLLTGFALLGVPAHGGVCLLAAHSLGLATVAVLVTAAALLAVALARRLGLDDLLQRLPLLLVLGLAGVALVYFTSLPSRKESGGGGFELMGGMLLLVVAVSVLGSLYRPLAAAYQSLTLRVPARDLCVAAAGLLVSLGLAAIGHTLPKPILVDLVCTFGGTFAGLVVVEYAAWARANPTCDLHRVMAFDRPRRGKRPTTGTARKNVSPFHAGAAVLAATLHGACFGLAADAVANGIGPASGLHRLYPPAATGNPEGTANLLTLLLAGSFVGLPLGLLWANTAMNALRPPDVGLALRLSWDAVVVFLTYPDTAHPLAHRLHLRWLRPPVVRLTVTAVVLLAIATGFFTPPATPEAAASESTTVAPAEVMPPPPPLWVPPADANPPRELAPIDRWRRQENAPPLWTPPPPPPVVDPTPNPSGPNLSEVALGLVVAPVFGLIFLLMTVAVVGSSVLPVYYRHFERPEPPAKT